MSNGSRTNFCNLSNDAICILKPVDRKIILPRVITLPHFPHTYFKLYQISQLKNVLGAKPRAVIYKNFFRYLKIQYNRGAFICISYIKSAYVQAIINFRFPINNRLSVARYDFRNFKIQLKHLFQFIDLHSLIMCQK